MFGASGTDTQQLAVGSIAFIPFQEGGSLREPRLFFSYSLLGVALLFEKAPTTGKPRSVLANQIELAFLTQNNPGTYSLKSFSDQQMDTSKFTDIAAGRWPPLNKASWWSTMTFVKGWVWSIMRLSMTELDIRVDKRVARKQHHFFIPFGI